jgi:DNA repair exonuclease SbcCD nuclease subunit
VTELPVRVLHCADLHLDSPFEALPADKARIRRQEQRALLDRIADIAEERHVQLVLLAGDLLDSAASYYETQEVLYRTFSRIKAEIFIAPGNHDYYCPKSPYASMKFPDNVHIFTSPLIGCFTLPELGCRVWGAGFNDAQSRPLLTGFRVPDRDADPKGGYLDLMVLHGDLTGDVYNHIREADIAASNLHYLALGHIHTFSGIKKAGNTYYAYPGCPEGRGFDETGEKGILTGTVDKSGCDLEFIPTNSRRYDIYTVDVTGASDIAAAVAAALPAGDGRDISRIILTGETDGTPDLARLNEALTDRFFHTTIQDMTRPARDIWADAGDDTLRGIFIRRLKEKYDAAADSEKDLIVRAVRYGLSALDNREEYEA